jgi:hypothetical protein
MKLKLTLTAEIEVTNLEDYAATTIQEAAINALAWMKYGQIDPVDMLLGYPFSVNIEPVESLQS